MGSTSHRFDGFFKSEFRVNEAVGRSVSYIRDGKLLGGNSGFAHIGTYRFDGDMIAVEVTSRRHNFGAAHQSLLGSDVSTIAVTGRAVGKAFCFEGGSPQMPNAIFRSVMTPLDESELRPRHDRRRRHFQRAVFDPPQDSGRRARRIDRGHAAQQRPHPRRRCLLLLSRVVFLIERPLERPDGQPGTHARRGRRPGVWRPRNRNRVFRDLRCEGGTLEGTALAGKRSIRFEAELKLICAA